MLWCVQRRYMHPNNVELIFINMSKDLKLKTAKGEIWLINLRVKNTKAFSLGWVVM